MRAFDPEVMATLGGSGRSRYWQRRQPKPPRLSRRRILVRMATGCALVSAEAICIYRVSDTRSGVAEASGVAAGVSTTWPPKPWQSTTGPPGWTAPCASSTAHQQGPLGREMEPAEPTDRGKPGWKWSLVCAGRASRWTGPAAARTTFAVVDTDPVITWTPSADQTLAPPPRSVAAPQPI